MAISLQQALDRRAIIRRSTKAGDIAQLRSTNGYIGNGGGLFQILVPIPSLARILPQDLPTSAKERDRVLSITPRVDAQWGAAVGIATTQVSSMSWDVEGSKGSARYLKSMLENADISVGNWTGGWVHFIGKNVRDYSTTNNGSFFGIIRKGTARGSKIIGIEHLSSIRCFRTGDPQFPVVYMDRWGGQHALRWYEVVAISDMPDSDDYLLGAGICAAERAYQQIRKLASLENYVYEKISGSRPLAIYIVSGLNARQLDKIMKDGITTQTQKGLTTYMGALVAATLKPDEQPGLVTIPLAELPDGFDAKQERDRADLIYANSIGLDPQDLAPIGGERQLGVGAQSAVLHDKAKGRGLAAYKVAIRTAINKMVASNKSRFYFTENDFVDKERAAKISRLRSDFVNGLVSRNILSPEEGKQLLAEWGEIPVSFVQLDITPGTEILADEENPDLLDLREQEQRRVMKDLKEQEEEKLLEEAVALQKAQDEQAKSLQTQLQSQGPMRSGGQGTTTIPPTRVPVRATK